MKIRKNQRTVRSAGDKNGRSRVRLSRSLIFSVEDYTSTGHFRPSRTCNPIVIHSDVGLFPGEKNPENPVIPDGQE